jgi:hypothetical protein
VNSFSSIHSDVYSNKNTQGLENGAGKSFMKASILLHQRSDSCAEALLPINLSTEMNASHFFEESTERPIHSLHQDLSSRALNQGVLSSFFHFTVWFHTNTRNNRLSTCISWHTNRSNFRNRRIFGIRGASRYMLNVVFRRVLYIFCLPSF